MQLVWQLVEETELAISTKNRLYITSMTIIDLVLGTLAWCLVGRIFLPGVDWLLCFMGYPAVFGGVIGSVMYLYNHEFS